MKPSKVTKSICLKLENAIKVQAMHKIRSIFYGIDMGSKLLGNKQLKQFTKVLATTQTTEANLTSVFNPSH